MRLIILLYQLARVLEGLMTEVTKECRLTVADALVMAWIQSKPGIGCGEIARCLGRNRSNVHRTLVALERWKLAERDGPPDKPRDVGWYLTGHGQLVWKDLAAGFKRQTNEANRRQVKLDYFMDGLAYLIEELVGAKGQRSAEPELFVPPEKPKVFWDGGA